MYVAVTRFLNGEIDSNQLYQTLSNLTQPDVAKMVKSVKRGFITVEQLCSWAIDVYREPRFSGEA